MATVIKCPVCANPVSGNVCNHCGWMRLLFPAEVPASLKSLNSEYVETLKKVNQAHSTTEKRKNELEQSVKASNEKISRLAAEKEEVLNKLKDTERKSDTLLVGVVEVEYAPTGKYVFIPIFDGFNSYGTEDSHDIHHKIKIRMINDPDILRPKHFYAYKNPSDGRMYVAPINGAELFYNGTLLKSPHMVKFSDVVKINDNIRIRISAC